MIWKYCSRAKAEATGAVIISPVRPPDFCAMAQRNNLTRKDIDELYAILERAEEELK